jgi:hypothetical protein
MKNSGVLESSFEPLNVSRAADRGAFLERKSARNLVWLQESQ